MAGLRGRGDGEVMAGMAGAGTPGAGPPGAGTSGVVVNGSDVGSMPANREGKGKGKGKRSAADRSEDRGAPVAAPELVAYESGSIGDGEFDFRPFFLHRDRMELYGRIGARCEEMVGPRADPPCSTPGLLPGRIDVRYGLRG